MDTLRINTSQNIDIEQPIASVGERVVATSIDMLFMLCYFIVIAFISTKTDTTSLLFVGLLPIAFYNLLSEIFMNGQSWGKRILKIKVIKTDGTEVTFSSYFLRWIIGLIEIFIFFGSLALIAIIINRKGQRLGDIAANTAIIRVNEKKLAPSSLVAEIPENYEVVYPGAAKLSIKDIYTLQDVLDVLMSYNPDVPKVKLAYQTRIAIEQKLNITSEQNDILFFKTLISDYNFLNSR